MPTPSIKQAIGAATTAPAEADLIARLQAAGLRVTQVRLRVLQALLAQPTALSHAEIETGLLPGLDRVTLYRTLDSFVEAGLAHKQVGSERVTRFALVDGADHSAHAHFECDSCHSVYCMPVKPPSRTKLPLGFEVAGAALQFHGQCPACNKSARP